MPRSLSVGVSKSGALAKLKATGEFAAIIEPYGFSAEATAGESYLTRCPDGK